MADDWNLFSPPSRRRQTSLQSRLDAYLGFGEVDGGEEDLCVEFACPFCSEDFDLFGLCCHIDDEHPDEAKDGICPVCADRVEMDMVNHITLQHGNYFKMLMLRKKKYRRSSSSSHSTLSLLKKELRDGNLHSLLGGSSFLAPNVEAAPDPLLFSFINNIPSADSSCDVESQPLDSDSSVTESLQSKVVIESAEPMLSQKDQEERAQRSAFLQELLLSTIF